MIWEVKKKQSEKLPLLIILFILCVILFSFITRAVLFSKAFPIHIHIISLFVLLFVGISVCVWRKKVKDNKERERQLNIFLKYYGMFFAFLVIICPILLIMFLLILIATGSL
jgi:L-asparagine transporter-like permease